MTRLRWLTAGESHGPMLVATLEGVPAGLALDEDLLARELARRQLGFGRGGRMKIESDRARIVGGVRHGRTLGSPVALLLENKDFANWATRMQVAPLAEGQDPGPPVTLPRPGHADLAGGIKYRADDLRDVLERASARETAARVALGAVAKALLASLGVEIGSQVRSIHEAAGRAWDELVPEARFDAALLAKTADSSEVRSADLDATPRMIEAIQAAQKRRDTVGGTFEVVVSGLPPGLGSYAQWDRRLDMRLVGALASIPAVKAAEVGDGWDAARRFGTEVHDAIHRKGPAILRATNRAGGTEGGISNGEPLVVRAAMKPIATVSNALPSVDLRSGLEDRAHVERSDTCAVPAAAVIGEAVVALEVARILLETWGSDTMLDLAHQVRRAWRRARLLPSHLYLCGLSGSGKTTVGRLVAEALSMPFVDLDAEVERAAGAPIRDIFARDGEAAFRALELETLKKSADSYPTVIALGGGAVLSAEARDLLRRTGDVFWLHASTEVLYARVGNDFSRPLLAGDPAAALARLAAERNATYARVGDARIDAAARPEVVAQRVVGAREALE